MEKIKIESCVNSRNVYGGTAPEQVLSALKRAEEKHL
jgi:argininosuccinate lyase